MEKLELEEMLALLAVARPGRLLTLDRSRNEPYLVPVSFVLLAGSIYFYTEAGRKLAALRNAPRRVGFEIDGHDGYVAWSILASGHFVEVRSPLDRTAATAGLLAKYRGGAVAPIWARSGGNVAAFVRNLAAAEMGAIRIAR
ncbi:MAG: pyridoxamine 5'-phosphate oxidase family protein, partial [Chloroflexota bacterium]